MSDNPYPEIFNHLKAQMPAAERLAIELAEWKDRDEKAEAELKRHLEPNCCDEGETCGQCAECALLACEAEVQRQSERADKAEALVASYDRQDELIGTEFDSVDEVTDVIRILKGSRDELDRLCKEHRERADKAEAACAAMRKTLQWILSNLQRYGTPISVIDGVLNLCEQSLSTTAGANYIHCDRLNPLVESLIEIRDRCQLTGVSFEEQSDMNTVTAIRALQLARKLKPN